MGRVMSFALAVLPRCGWPFNSAVTIIGIPLQGSFQFGPWKKPSELRMNDQAEQGKKQFGTAVLFFGQGLTWFRASSPGGIFALLPLHIDNAFVRAEIVIAAIVRGYGMPVWRSASRKLSLANYRIVSSCASVLLLRASKLSE
jgi:hypothetical protein